MYTHHYKSESKLYLVDLLHHCIIIINNIQVFLLINKLHYTFETIENKYDIVLFLAGKALKEES